MYKKRTIAPLPETPIYIEPVEVVKSEPKPLQFDAPVKYRVSLYEVYTEQRRKQRMTSNGIERYEVIERFLKPLKIGELNAISCTFGHTFDQETEVEHLVNKYKRHKKDDRIISQIRATVENLITYDIEYITI